MGQYSIKDLEQLSGIKAHTIRIWEQRYNLLTPNRTDTNFRYYDDNQLRKLINTVSLLRAGMKISKIGQLPPEGMKEKLEAIHKEDLTIASQYDIYVNNLITSGLTFDEYLFEKAFSEAVRKYGFYATIKNITYPLLLKVGLMWGKNDLSPAQEHFVSNLIKRKLFAAIDSIGLPPKEKPATLLFLPEWEDHEIGLLFSHYMLKSNGEKCIYLGQRVPYENLIETIEEYRPQQVVTFFVITHPQEEVQYYVESLSNLFPSLKIAISGSEWMVNEINTPANVTLISSLSTFEKAFRIRKHV